MNDDNATAAEVKALRKTVSDLAAKVENLEELVAESHKVLLALSQPADRTAQHQVREARASEDYRVDAAETSEPAVESVKYLSDGTSWGSLVGEHIPTAVSQGRKGAKVLGELIRAYGAVDRVRAIAVGQQMDEVLVYVLIDMGQHYNDELIGTLLEVEFDLHGEFKPLCLSMSYIPVGDGEIDESDCLGGTLIWMRDSVPGE